MQANKVRKIGNQKERGEEETGESVALGCKIKEQHTTQP